ncbi:hypothetical protein LJ655_23780 [Paraburkholderia sp. MMS20-SJTN17]|uniref:CdiI immunity protein domain-containing protein n=1 Tax=Paraburkholderia translucens TaxID=2886945 RepID=A0ABS8KJ95_9BURK|nr:contact-dependent growth inhibition system immunity protein [Paraburkholderia sp. MMS20-SJTN17]MCC8404856.1 hypothetical protein [Paraburkholderia sp. MMS20-SJTN17]
MTMNNGKYSNLEQLIMGRFHEDYSLYGDSIPDLVLSYKRGMNQTEKAAALKEIEQLKEDNRDNLDAAFEDAFGCHVDPVLWGHTAASFLDELKRLLSE